MARKRHLREPDPGARRVPAAGKPGPGRRDRGVFAEQDAHGGNRVRLRASGGPDSTDSRRGEPSRAASRLRSADDGVDGDLAIHRQRSDGRATGTDGVDPGDRSG